MGYRKAPFCRSYLDGRAELWRPTWRARAEPLADGAKIKKFIERLDPTTQHSIASDIIEDEPDFAQVVSGGLIGDDEGDDGVDLQDLPENS